MRRLLLAMLMATTACDSSRTAEESRAPAEPPPLTFDGAIVQDAAAKLAHGERLTRVLGCTGCHGRDLQGRRFYELYASNLTRDVPMYNDAELERLLRAGVHPSGRDLWGMPSELFQHLSAPDMAGLIAHLRTLPPDGKPTQPPLPFEPETKKLIAAGVLKPAAAFVRESKGIAPVDLGPTHVLGRYITRVTCAECHGPELKGNPRDTPDLVVAGGYTREQFETLMTSGKPVGGRKLRLMDIVAPERFAKLTPHERDALYAYLKARADRPQ